MKDDYLALLSSCNLCPRACGANRTAGRLGACGAGASARVALAALHHWEEPPISGTRGSGAVFFSRCNMRCLYCQNHTISQGGRGRNLSLEELAGTFMRLQDEGAHNINLVSPTPYIPQIAAALGSARRLGLTLPVVYNTGSYERPEALELLTGLVQVFLPDMKYAGDRLGEELSGAAGYFSAAAEAIQTMRRMAPEDAFDSEGIMTAGMIVRHLVLPGHSANTRGVLQWIAAELGGQTHVSLMSQYTPDFRAASHPPLDRLLRPDEYRRALDDFDRAGLENGYCQDMDSASSEYTPSFDLRGLPHKR